MVHSNARRLWAVLGTALFIAAACGGGTTPAASGAPSGSAAGTASTVTQPTRPVEFVISTAPGGGSDIYARFWQGIIEKNKLSPQPVQPVNKEGGSGAVAFTYVFEKKGDMHYIMVTLNSFFTTIITQKLPYKASDFTPIANMALDPFFLWVNEDSPWKTAQDFVTAAKANSLVVAGTGSKQEDEALFDRIADTMGTKPFTYVPQTSGSTVAAALAGHQGGVVATVNNPSEGLGLFQANPKKVRPICAFLPDSPKAGPYSGLATCKSQGIAIDDYYVVRMIVGPPGLTAEQQKFWADVFKKVYDSADWQKFVSDNALNPDFRTGVELRQLISQYQQLHQDIATKFKWVK